MPVLIQYFVKVSICLAVAYIFYLLVLRRLTFYNSNRLYLLAYTLLSFVIPFINISPALEQDLAANNIIKIIPVIENYTLNQNGLSISGGAGYFNIWNWILFIFSTGLFIFSARLIIQYFSFRAIKRNAQLLSDDGMKIYQVNKDIIPFSFGNSIFINQKLHNEEDLKEIIRHEYVHIKQKHTIDIMWSELLCIVNWYNPFAWFIRKAIRRNLEFIADSNVIENGMDKKQYQYLLLKVIGIPRFSITNQFNFSSLKKRIAMMNKMKSAKVHLIKFLFVLPLVAILLLAFRDENMHIKQINKQKILIKGQSSFPPAMDVTTSNSIAGQNKSDTIPAALVNSKGYFINIIDNNGHCTVEVKNTSKRVIEKVDLLKWNANKLYYEKLYGIIPPPPPPSPPQPQIEKSPTTESDDSQMPITSALQSIPGTSTHSQSMSTQSSSVMAATAQAERAIRQKELAGLQSAIATTAQGNVSSAVSAVQSDAPAGITLARGEKILELRIYKTTSKTKLDQLIADAKSKGFELTFDLIDYNPNGQLAALSGAIKKEGSTQHFHANDFEIVILIVYKENNRTYFRVSVSDKKEEV